MCELCLTDAETIVSTNPSFEGGFLPGYFLVKAKKDSGMAMKVGDYGLVRRNDPDFVFSVEPVRYATDNEEAFFDAAGRLEEQVLASARSLDAISALSAASKEAGWDGTLPLAAWLCHRLAAYMGK